MMIALENGRILLLYCFEVIRNWSYITKEVSYYDCWLYYSITFWNLTVFIIFNNFDTISVASIGYTN